MGRQPERRMLRRSLSRDRAFGQLSIQAQLFYTLAVVAADDQGRLPADPDTLKLDVCPRIRAIDDDDIPGILEELETHGFAQAYEAGGEPVLQLLQWWAEQQSMQWAYPSDFPPPDGWDDRLRFRHDNHVITLNWPDTGDGAVRGNSQVPLADLAERFRGKPGQACVATAIRKAIEQPASGSGRALGKDLAEALGEAMPEAPGEPIAERSPEPMADGLAEHSPKPMPNALADGLPKPLPEPLPEPITVTVNSKSKQNSEQEQGRGNGGRETGTGDYSSLPPGDAHTEQQDPSPEARPEPGEEHQPPAAPRPSRPRPVWAPPDWFQPLTELEGYKPGDHSAAAEAIRRGCEVAGADPATVVETFAAYWPRGRLPRSQGGHGWRDPTKALVTTLEVQIGKVQRDVLASRGSSRSPQTRDERVAGGWGD